MTLTIWHDVECGSYQTDLPLWRELAAAAGPRARVLDVGAGTGRVTLNLARAGHAVVALDVEEELLGALRAHAGALRVGTVRADAQAFDLGTTFDLVLAPMQTIQLLDDPGAFVTCAARHLAPGGLAAIAIAAHLEPFEPELELLPVPDVAEHGGTRYVSQPVAVRREPGAARIERVRTVLARDGSRSDAGDVVRLRDLSTAGVESLGRRAGLVPEPARAIPPTSEHVGSDVVLLRG